MDPRINTDINKDRAACAILGAAMAVHRELGHGFLESVYQEALEREFQYKNIVYERQKKLPIFYRGVLLKSSFQADFVCYGSVIVELKALQKITDDDEAQLINCLKASNIPKGLLLNFGAKSLQYKRLVFDPHESSD